MEESVPCTFVTATRPDTVKVCLLPDVAPSQAYVLLQGIRGLDGVMQEVVDWCEDKFLAFVPSAFGRDTYGRIIGDIIEEQTGESLVSHLLLMGYAEADPTQVRDIVEEMSGFTC